MPQAVTAVLTALAAVLEPLTPFTKAVVPAALGVATALVNWLVAGTFDAVSITSAVGGLVVAIAVYLLPNKDPKAKPTSATVPTPAAPAGK